MRLPVATTDPTPRGFSWTTDGELVMMGFICDRDLADPDMGCGCGRSFAGLDSHKGTTRAVVQETSVSDLSALRAVVVDSLSKGGWDTADEEWVAEVCAEMVEIGELFPEGTVLGRRLYDVFPVGV